MRAILFDTARRDALAWWSPKVAAFGAAYILALLSAWTTGMIGPAIPTLATPLPFPWFLLVILGGAFLALPTGLFLIWGWPLFYGRPTSRKRTRAAAAVIGLLSLVWFRGGWDYGLKYQDFHYTLTTAIGSFVFAAAIAAILASRKRADRFTWSLTANFLLFAWLLTYAFPYLGELP
jgi:hypothetical protein